MEQSLVPGRIKKNLKDLIIESKSIWYITGGMDPGPAPAEKRSLLSYQEMVQ
jgi:hypothetical protein